MLLFCCLQCCCVYSRCYYLQLLHGELCAVLLGALHQDVQSVAVIFPLCTQWLLPNCFFYAFLEDVSSTDSLQNMQKKTSTIRTLHGLNFLKLFL